MALFVGRGNFPKKFQPKKKNWDQICNYCKLQGHIKEKFYMLNGYPSDWKFKKKFGQNQDTANMAITQNEMADVFASANTVMTGKATDLGSIMTQPTFNPSQYIKILSILEREDAGTNADKTSDSLANMAGITTTLNALYVSNDTEKGEAYWIVDLGATCHMTCKLDRLCHASNCVNRKVHLPNGKTAQVSHVGCCNTIDGSTLKNMLVVLEFKHNLLSVSK